MILNALNNQSLTPAQLYSELYEAHKYARKNNESVTYPSNRSFTVEPNGPYIELGKQTDFNGCTITVTGGTTGASPMFLFAMDLRTAINGLFIDKEAINSGDFSNISGFPSGDVMLIVKDSIPYTIYEPDNSFKNRSDIILVKDRQALNHPIAPYDNESLIEIEAYTIDRTEKSVKNLNFIRPYSSALLQHFRLLAIRYQDNLTIENISVTTEAVNGITQFIHDSCFKITESTNVTMKDITIDKTYSRMTADYGYGIELNKVWNITFNHIVATNPAWGVFGTNNVNTAYLVNCQLNRFDIHLYGKDITCENCTFTNDNEVSYPNTQHLINRYTAIFGFIRYVGCTFNHFVPIRIDKEFQIYTNFDLYMENCTINLKDSRPYIIEPGRLNSSEPHKRYGLEKRNWPNLYIKSLSIVLPSNFPSNSNVYLFRLDTAPSSGMQADGISWIKIVNAITVNKPIILQFCNYDVRLSKYLFRSYNGTEVYFSPNTTISSISIT